MSLDNFTLMKQLLEQYFLLRSGKRAMKGNLMMGDYAVQFTSGGGIYEVSNVMQIHPLADAKLLGNLEITGNLTLGGIFYWDDLITNSTAGSIQTKTGASNVLNLQGRKGALPILVTVAQIVNSPSVGVNPWLNIPCAGDITLLSGKLINAINGVLRLPDSRPASPQAGNVRYDSATDTFEIYDGISWNPH